MLCLYLITLCISFDVPLLIEPQGLFFSLEIHISPDWLLHILSGTRSFNHHIPNHCPLTLPSCCIFHSCLPHLLNGLVHLTISTCLTLITCIIFVKICKIATAFTFLLPYLASGVFSKHFPQKSVEDSTTSISRFWQLWGLPGGGMWDQIRTCYVPDARNARTGMLTTQPLPPF